MGTFSPVNLNPKEDRDALSVLALSFLILLLSGGLFYIYLLFMVNNTARNTPASADDAGAVYLVFGKKLSNDRPDAEFRTRLLRLLACPYQEAILMGGQTADANVSEAQAGYDFIQDSGRPFKTIRLENRSRNTLENLQNTRQLLNGRRTIIISNRYHLARCSILAGNMKINHRLCAAESIFHFDIGQLVKYLQEAFYLHWFYCGKYWAEFTNNQRMLSKIS